MLAQPAMADKFPSHSAQHREVQADSAEDTLVSELIQRGISQTQARKLIAGRSAVERHKIENILRYYDHLVATEDRRISRNKVGFLYRAVETPYKFSVPPAFNLKADGEERTGTADRRTVRPELRVFRASRRAADSLNSCKNGAAESLDTSETSLRQRYLRYSAKELSRVMTQLSLVDKSAIHREVEQKMSFLKSVLGEAGYRNAVEGAAQEEIKRRFGIADFETWTRAQSNIA